MSAIPQDDWTQSRAGCFTLIYPSQRLSEREARGLLHRCSAALSAVREILGPELSIPVQISVILGDADQTRFSTAAESELSVHADYDPERPELALEVPLVRAILDATVGRLPEGAQIWSEGFAVYVASLPGASSYHAAVVERCRELQEDDLMPPMEALISGSEQHVSSVAAVTMAGFIAHLVRRRGKVHLGYLLHAMQRNYAGSFSATYKQPLAIADRDWRRELESTRSLTWRSSPRALAQLMPELQPFWIDGLKILTYSLIGIAFSLALPLSFRLLIDQILGRRPLTSPLPFIGPTGHVIGQGQEQIDSLLVLLAVLTGLFIANAASRVRLASLTASVGEAFLCRIRERMLRTLGMLPVSYYARTSPADVSQRVMVDSSTLQQTLVSAFVPLVTSVIAIAIYGVTLISMEPRLSVIAIGGLPILAIIYRLRRQSIRDAARERVRRVSALSTRIIELANVNMLSKAYLATPYILARLQVLLNIHRQLNIVYSRESATFAQAATLVTHLIQVAVLFVGGYLVVISGGNDLAAGGLASFYVLLNQVFAPIAQITASRQALIEAGPSVDRICQLLAEPGETENLNGQQLGALKDRLVIESLTFGYIPNRPVLHDVSITIPAGSTTAFVGPTGCGKSSMVALLPRLYDPWEGSIRWDGHDLQYVSLTSLRRQIALVPQDAPTLNASIYDNIVFGLQGVVIADVIAAARASQADGFIQLLPDGYDTMIGERGLGLSGGQRQRIALARALLRNPSVMILDEATSALDATTQRRVQEQLREHRPDRTIIKIAHRLETVADADNIVVLDDGVVVEQGRHSELIEHAGVYARLFRDQMRLLDAAGKPTTAQAMLWLKREPRFADISATEAEELERNMRVSHLHRGDVIVPAGAPPDSIFIIGRGRVELLITDENGSERAVGTLGPGDLIGRHREVPVRLRDTAARAASEVQIFALDRSRLEQILDAGQAFTAERAQ